MTFCVAGTDRPDAGVVEVPAAPAAAWTSVR
jgi:hypothetical protein